ncbi:hypothetical protein M378DRAFT_116676 [Amanita muscaria Koide BX008]|uniref:Brl1/Brr6 domain-containing protein n=1 Tax=Amanita muscaria (strain Koide BX008) TaxID=946122 RepID=A0A0C2T5A1_AMAMK|nr:hypothetical protein M378DRAFT_116676 [Amanita muscaria Koide BX008]
MKNVRTKRSTEAPMDFEWTNRANIKPVWATSDDTNSPRKRAHEELASPNPTLGTSSTTSFPPNQNLPFLFQPPQSPQVPSVHSWAPPPQFSPRKAFALPVVEETNDVDMTEASPGKSNESRNEVGRAVALGGLKRVYNRRHKLQSHSRQKQQQESESDDDRASDESGSSITTHNTSNHYTLNLPSHTASRHDIPYILSGYLQFFFNLSLILLFLYLVIQFIITVQRDVENRISEYSMEIVQEIAMCALQHKNNLCTTNPVPAMVQQCSNWETCMNRDPAVVGRAKVGAELVAEVVNGFVEPISWKTLIFGLTSLSFLTVFVNALLSLYRNHRQAVPVASPNSHSSAYPITSIPPFPPHNYGCIHPPGSDPASRDDDISNSNLGRRRRLEDGTSVKIK